MSIYKMMVLSHTLAHVWSMAFVVGLTLLDSHL